MKLYRAKKLRGVIRLSALLAIVAGALLFAGCAGAPAPALSAETAEAATVEAASETAPHESGGQEAAPAASWSISLRGVREDVLEASRFEEAKVHGSHYVEMELERKGQSQLYRGMPLYLIAAMVDGSDAEHPYTVDRSRWSSGYDITITGADGYSATFNTAEVDPNALILADSVDGMAVAPMIAGDAPGKLWVKDVVEIDLALGAVAQEEPQFELVLDINSKVSSFTLQELEESIYYVEQPGSYTTSAGSTYGGLWGGVRMADFLGQFLNLKPETSLTMVAMDGYEMTYSGKEVLDTSDGVWILAFKLDGEYLPMDPGYIRTIKAGPGNPNIPGHSSVRMLEKIVVKQEGYRDFSITISGKMEWTLDRQTIQSGVSCHKRMVDFERKGTAARYTGVPLYLLLAYADDPQYAPHRQSDKSILSYRKEIAQAGYTVEIEAADGFVVSLDSREVDGNEDLILGMYKNGEELPPDEFPLILVWDKNAKTVPSGAKPIKQITTIRLIF
jgi:hypothetical protein